MKPDISEFSYGYAVTEALIKRWRPTLNAAPVFPSLIVEGKVGYDVKIQRRGLPFFLQFKVCDCMVSAGAREAKQKLLRVPFYRMHLRPARHSNQHQLLCDLEGSGNIVRYVAPIFHTTAEFNDVFIAGQILRRSIFLRPSDIGPLPDGEDHHVAFENRNTWWFLSEPRRADSPTDEERFDHEVREALHERGATALSESSLRVLMLNIIDILERRESEESGRRARPHADFGRFLTLGDPLLQIAYLCRTFFGTECILVWEEAPSKSAPQ